MCLQAKAVYKAGRAPVCHSIMDKLTSCSKSLTFSACRLLHFLSNHKHSRGGLQTSVLCFAVLSCTHGHLQRLRHKDLTMAASSNQHGAEDLGIAQLPACITPPQQAGISFSCFRCVSWPKQKAPLLTPAFASRMLNWPRTLAQLRLSQGFLLIPALLTQLFAVINPTVFNHIFPSSAALSMTRPRQSVTHHWQELTVQPINAVSPQQPLLKDPALKEGACC